MADFDDEKQKKQLDDLRKLEEEQLIATLAGEKYGLPYIDLYHHIVDNEALRSVPEEEARELRVAPFEISGKNLYIALRSPQPEIIERVTEEITARGFVPNFYMASQASLEKVWSRYEELSMATTTQVGGVEISGEILRNTARDIKKMQDISAAIAGVVGENQIHKISRILEVILAGAIAIKASDVHIEPEKERARLRLRLDGILRDVAYLGLNIYHLLNSRIKLLSGMKLTTKITQDGRFSITEGAEEINIRASLIPGSYGEAIVLRIL